MKRQSALGAREMRRLLLVAAAAACAALVVLFLTQERHVGLVVIALERVWAALVASGVCLLAASGGLGVLARLRCEPEGMAGRFSFGLGAGLGVVSLATLLLGMMGLLQPWALLGFLLLWGVAGFRASKRFVGDLLAALRKERGGGFSWNKALWVLVAALFAMNLTRAFEPPWEYDVLEYHLGAPAIWHSEGRVTFLRHNVYSNMTLNTQMLYLLGMSLRGDRLAGARVGFLFNVGMGLAAALAIRDALAKRHSRTAGDAAAAIYYAWPGISLYSGTGHIEVAQQFYVILALSALARFAEIKLARGQDAKPVGATPWLVASGGMAGFAIGVKYPSALFALVPVVALAFVVTWLAERCPRKAVAAGALAFGVAMATVSPWLARNVVNTRNPTYPLLYSVFGSTHWSGEQEARWQSRHSPGPMTPAELVRKTRAFFAGAEDGTESALLFAFLPLLLLTDRKRLPVALALLGYAAFCILGWFFFTHRADRFLAPVVPVFAALGGVGVGSLGTPGGRRAALGALLGLALLGPGAWRRYILVERSLGSALGESPSVFFDTAAPQFRVGFRAMQFINDPQNVPLDATILFFPEARTFWCEREVIAPTPFDRSPMEETVAAAQSPGDIAASLRELGATHLLVNYSEIGRLVRTGDFFYDGRRRRHRLDGFEWDLFQSFLDQRAVLVEGFGGEADRATIELYRLAR